MSHALLPGDTANEGNDGAVTVDAQLIEEFGLARLPQLRIDAVEDDMDLVRVDIGVDIEDGGLHACRHSNDGVSILNGVALRPRGDVVTAAELFALPRAVGFERVCGDHVWNSVELPRKVASKAGVPGVRVRDIGCRCPVGHAQARAQRLKRAVGIS